MNKCNCNNRSTIFGCQCHKAKQLKDLKEKELETLNEVRAQIALGMLKKKYLHVYNFVRRTWRADEMTTEFAMALGEICREEDDLK